MINFKCVNHSCNGLICETSICPICNNRTQLNKSEIYWSNKLNCPIFDKENDESFIIGSDLRPVFPQERLLIEILLGKPMEYCHSSVWNIGGSTYIIDGKKIILRYNQILKQDINEIIGELIKYQHDNLEYEDDFMNSIPVKNFIEANKMRYITIRSEANDYLREVAKDYSLDEMFVSFSGGKDSTVTSDLVVNAISKNVIHIFGDTTLEYPKTGEYIKRLKENNRDIPILSAINRDQNFDDLCGIVGPPSRVMRWCCTIFKTGPIAKRIEQTFKEKKRILTFYGVRRSESQSRNKYDRESDSPKITKQRVVSPIIDWLDFDVWLYILTRNIDFNEAYRQGFSRVGCWCCPNNGTWSEFLSSIYMREEYLKLREILYTFARKVGKEDWQQYIDDGKWKARQGGNGLEIAKNAVVAFKPCVTDASAYNFEMTKPITLFLYTLFIPFGNVDYTLGNPRLNEVFILNRKNREPIMKLSGRIGENVLKITILGKINGISSPKTIESMIKNQITKYQTCIGCSACQSVCKFNAIKINTNSESEMSYIIDDKKCIGCLECVKHFDGGCYLKKVLRTKLEVK